MKVLVTGGAGFIGSHVVDAYVAAGHDVVVVDNLSTGRRHHLPASVRFYELDIRSPDLRAAFERERPEIVNHHAAQSSVVISTADPRLDAEVNVLGTVNLLALCAQFSVRRIIFASTGGAIYGNPEHLPVDETHPAQPLAPYGISKLAGEYYVRHFAQADASWAILRYANVYGPRQDPSGEAGVVAIFARAMLDGRAPTVFGQGSQTRDFVYVEDVAKANVLAAKTPVSSLANIASGRETSVNDIAQHLRDLTGYAGPVLHAAPRPGEVDRVALDPGRARRWLGWSPATLLDEGLHRTVQWFRTQR